MAERKTRILVLTRDPRVSQLCREALQQSGRRIVDVRESGTLASMLERGARIAIVDLGMPDRTLETTAAALGEHRDLPVLALASGSASQWYRISRGNPLEEVLEAPYSGDDVAAAVDSLLSKSGSLNELLVGRSEAVQELRDRVLLIAPTPVTTLITGESGTGKDVVARALHRYSPRHKQLFKAVNCAAIPENLLENELFGHEKGAFTDARSQFPGVFEQASGGTVFLDEIGEMALSAQVRLLRVVEEREVTRIGGTEPISVDLRLLAATNRDLRDAVANGEFRRDLYHRLKVVELNISPLRQRREDIPLLIDHFVAQYTLRGAARFGGFSPPAMNLLLEYHWPGNVRELRNLIEHLVFLGPDRPVEPADLHGQLESPPPQRHLPVPTGKTPDQSERELIYFALLDLKREVSELKQLLQPGPAESAPRPVYQVNDRVGSAGIAGHVRGIGSAEVTEASELVELETKSLKDLERHAIEQALEQVGGNRRQAAEKLGIGVRTLYRKLDEYGLK